MRWMWPIEMRINLLGNNRFLASRSIDQRVGSAKLSCKTFPAHRCWRVSKARAQPLSATVARSPRG